MLFAIPIFIIYTYTAKIGGYDLLTLHPDNVLPPIPIYLADYSLTFTTKLLIGSITGLFTDKITLDQMYTVCGIANIVAVALLALLGAALLRQGMEKKKYSVIFIFSLFVLDPMIPQEYYPAIGGYNTFWTMLFVILIFMCTTRVFQFAVPFFCMIGMLVHDGFVFSFLPAVMALLVYDFCHSETKREKMLNAASFTVTGGMSMFLLLYSSFFQNRHLKMTADEFHSYMLSRFDISFGERKMLEKVSGPNLFPYSFFELYFFDRFSDAENASDMSFMTHLSQLHGYILDTLSVKFYLSYLAAFLPFCILFAVLWGLCAKKSTGVKKIPFIFFSCIQFVVFPVGIISTDFHRWIPAAIISQIALLFAMLVKNDNTVSDVLSSAFIKRKCFLFPVIVCTAAYLIFLALFSRELPMMDDII